MDVITEMSGVVLAGGESARMGRDKVWLDYGGKPLIAHQLEGLSCVFADVRISAKDPGPFAGLGYPVVTDGSGVRAPIFGIAASLRALGRPVFVLAVDLPLFPKALVEHVAQRLLAGDASCVALRAGGKIHGLCAAYRPSVLDTFERNAARGELSVSKLVAECGGTVEEENVWGRLAGPEAFSNWNRPEDAAMPRG